MLLVVVDAHSTLIDTTMMTTSQQEQLSKTCGTFLLPWGSPKMVVIDNGPTFTSVEFSCFLKESGTIHSLTSPYHKSFNGLSESAVQTVKLALSGAVETRL